MDTTGTKFSTDTASANGNGRSEIEFSPALTRIPPQSGIAEQSIVGACIYANHDPEKFNLVLDLIKPEYFYFEANRAIFETAKMLRDHGDAVDGITIPQALENAGMLDACGGIPYIMSCAETWCGNSGLITHCQIMKASWKRRKMIEYAGHIIGDAYEDYESTAEQILGRAEQKFYSIASESHKGEFVPLSSIVTENVGEIEVAYQRYASGEGSLHGLSTGIFELDNMLGGMSPALYVVGGRPSHGKTSLACSFALECAKQDKTAAIFSLEMKRQELGYRYISAEACVNSVALKTGNLQVTEQGDDWAEIMHAAGKLSQLKILIDDSSDLTVSEIRSRVRRLKQHHDVGLVVIDYFQLIRQTGASRDDSENTRFAVVARQIKNLPKELDIPVVIISSLNRNTERRESKEPRLSDLYNCGTLEFEADVCMFVHRPWLYHRPDDCELESGLEPAQLQIAKNRNGPTGVVKLQFNKSLAIYQDPYSSSSPGYHPAVTQGNAYAPKGT